MASPGETTNGWWTWRLSGGLIALCSAIYNWICLPYGFNPADFGNYAQIARELLGGTDIHDIRLAYGPLWFKLGEGLFALGGVDYRLALLVFYGLITATALLTFVVVGRLTGQPGLAAAAALIAAAFPAFPATAFYPFCVLLVLWALLPAAEHWRDMRPRHMIAPAAGVALTFQIRPDFGYVLLALLGGLTLLGAVAGGRGAPRRLLKLAGVALAAFAAAHVPLMIDALRQGYGDIILADYLQYPMLIINYAVHGAPTAGGRLGSGAGTLLQRPPLWALWGGSGAERSLAFLIYAPVAIMAGFVATALWRAARGRAGRDALPAAAAVLGAALTTFPHYFLYRPDIAHIANFMPGFLTLCALLIHLLAPPLAVGGGGMAGALASGGRRLGQAAAAAPGLVFLLFGLSDPALWTIRSMEGRTERFVGANGVDVRVSPDEKAQLETIRAVIEAHSAPGEPIVCAPYCPGFVFMTDRRMLLREYYLDDMYLVFDPGWIERAIARSERTPPAVAVVMNWAINGTEISRFDNWAAAYVDFLRSRAVAVTPFSGGVAYVLRRP